MLINVKQQGVRGVPEEAVDLGLSVIWASCNVGASSSEDYGGYYAWGELSEKDVYSWETYKWGEKTSPYSFDYLMTKYNSTDKLRSLQSEDDVANMVMGENWRIPTKQECEELWNGCIWTEVAKNGVLGYEGKSRINGETIFIPFAGIKVKDNINSIGTEFGIWTSERFDENKASLLTNSLGIGIWARERYVGLPIRAVYE